MYRSQSVPLRGPQLTQPTRRFAAFVHVPHAVTALVRHVLRLWRARRDRIHLAELDDHLLADIGIARQDIRVAVGDPRWLPSIRG